MKLREITKISKTLSSFAALCVLLGGWFAASAQAQSAATSQNAMPQNVTSQDERVQAAAEYFERLEKLGFSGSLMIARHGEPLLARGYGMADRETGRKWTPSTVSTIGSITKQFTGAAILALVDDELLDVSDPITKYFEDVPEDKRAITIYQLLTHASGIVDLDGFSDWDPINREEFVRRAMEQDLEFAPGEDFAYSNAGYSLLGAIIEQITGENYERFLHRRLLHPAGVYETGYVYAPWGEDRLAQGYDEGERWGTVLERPTAKDGPFWVLRANGGIHSNAFDMLRWVEALRTGRVLSDASRKELWSRHRDEGYGDSFYGYGWVRFEQDGPLLLGHNGGNRIFFADLGFYPDSGWTIFLQTNAATELPIVERLMNRTGEHLHGLQGLPKLPDVVERDPEILAKTAGEYFVKGGGRATLKVEDGGLRLIPDDAAAFAALASNRAVDLDRAQRLSARVEKIMGWLEGDYVPLYEAYAKEYPIERLRQNRERMVRYGEERYGALQGFRVLGTAAHGEFDKTLVHVLFERGRLERTYHWKADEKATLDGLGPNSLPETLRVFPEAGGDFATWNPANGQSHPLVFQEGEAGLEWTLGTGEFVVQGRAAINGED